jgi:hypothetical protein
MSVVLTCDHWSAFNHESSVNALQHFGEHISDKLIELIDV